MEELLIAEFRPVVEALVDAAEAELDAHVVISVQRFSQSGRDLIAMLNRRRLDLEADRRDQGKAEPGALIRQYRTRQKQLEQHVRDCTRIADALKILVSRCAALRLDLRAEAQDG